VFFYLVNLIKLLVVFFEFILRVLSLFLMLAPRSTNLIDIQVGGFHLHKLLFERLDDNFSKLLILH